MVSVRGAKDQPRENSRSNGSDEGTKDSPFGDRNQQRCELKRREGSLEGNVMVGGLEVYRLRDSGCGVRASEVGTSPSSSTASGSKERVPPQRSQKKRNPGKDVTGSRAKAGGGSQRIMERHLKNWPYMPTCLGAWGEVSSA